MDIDRLIADLKEELAVVNLAISELEKLHDLRYNTMARGAAASDSAASQENNDEESN